MKSEPDGTEFVGTSEAEVRARLLPEKGAVFEIVYMDEEGETMTYGEKPHASVLGNSDGLKVAAMGPKCRMSHSRQMKPVLPSLFQGDDGVYRRMLRIALGGDEAGNGAQFYVHILGDLIVIGEEKMNVAQMVGDKSLTPTDQALMDALRKG